VDLDLEKFFDRVNHDILMARLARRIGDKRLLRMVRRFLQAGMMVNSSDGMFLLVAHAASLNPEISGIKTSIIARIMAPVIGKPPRRAVLMLFRSLTAGT
jgi:hypothetical protein